MSEGAASFWVEKEGWKTVRPSKEERGQGKKAGEGRGRGVQITERDVAVIAWIADQYAVRSDVLRWLLGDGEPLSQSRTRALIARWQRAGLVHAKRFFAGSPQVVWPTREGTRLVRPGWRWREPTVAMLAHHHAVSVVRLGIERRGQGTDWVCERTLYQQRTVPDAHVPDGVFRSSQGTETAVEVELTVKSAERLRGIVRDLTLDHAAVLYVVGDHKVGIAVEAAVRSAGEEDRVNLVGLDRLRLPGVR